MPETAEEAVPVAEAIITGYIGDLVNPCIWTSERIRAGDWTSALWFDGEFAETLFRMVRVASFAPAARSLGSTGRAAQDS